MIKELHNITSKQQGMTDIIKDSSCHKCSKEEQCYYWYKPSKVCDTYHIRFVSKQDALQMKIIGSTSWEDLIKMRKELNSV